MTNNSTPTGTIYTKLNSGETPTTADWLDLIGEIGEIAIAASSQSSQVMNDACWAIVDRCEDVAISYKAGRGESAG